MNGIAFDAFRDRGRRGVLIGASVAFWFCVFALLAALVFVGAGPISDYLDWAKSILAKGPGAALTTPALSVFWLIPLALAYVFVWCILFASYEAACLRWLVRGEVGGLFGLTLGA